MDYARFNYVAQPEDSMTEQELIPRIGAYDEWAIEWRYRWVPSFKNAAAEKEYLNQWVIKKLEDPALLYAYSGSRCKAEDLGDDAVSAGKYGIKNLKRILPDLLKWAKLQDENYDAAGKMEDQLMYQYKRYLSHVSQSIGGRYLTPKTVEQTGNMVDYADRTQQKAAVNFLQEELFKSPNWLFNKQLYAATGGAGYMNVLNIQKDVLSEIMSPPHNQQGDLLPGLTTLKSLYAQPVFCRS
jgi:hypothetical protein